MKVPKLPREKVLKTLTRFVEVYPNNLNDWNFVMRVVDKIELLIEHSIDIKGTIHIGWWYSPKKTGTFPKGAGGGGGHTVERTPFEMIFGKYHEISVCYGNVKDLKFKANKNDLAERKIDAVCLACFRWINWYNKTVKPSKQTKPAKRAK